MIFNTTGHIDKDFHVTGMSWSPSYLLNDDIPLLFEAGFYAMGPLYAKDITSILGYRSPKYLFLTHVHYDHCGAAPYFKKIFPELTICASKRASEILQRPNAIELMIALSRNFTRIADTLPGIDHDSILRSDFEPFKIDVVFDKEEVFAVHPGLSVQILFTPGHTRDMLSYYVPERKILIATESAGCRSQTGRIISEFLVDFDAYIRSLQRLSKLDIDIFCQGHHFVYTGSDVKEFFDASMKSALAFRDHVFELLKNKGNSIERVLEMIRREEYDPNPGPKQPEKAYLLNLKTRIAHLAGKVR
ncbi:MAG: MBL fold metallo-hydrolase [Syntrophorhabdaceae bacterium]